MKTIIGILCLVLPVVLAYWDVVAPAIKNIINPLTHKSK